MSEPPKRTRGLGRGLSALMADVSADRAQEAAPSTSGRSIQTLPIERLRPNPDQPRRSFRTEPLEELTRSIAEKGVLQPLIVRQSPDDPTTYQIVAGERRWRAAQAAQVHEVPVLIREFDDTEVLEVAIIENIQREDLNPLEEADGYQQLMDKFGHTQSQLADALGKSRSHIANLTRLLTLPAEVRTLVAEGSLTAGHARTLVGRDDAVTLARQIVAKGLSVREAEALTRKPADVPASTPKSSPAGDKDADTRQIELELAAHLGMKVTITHGKDGESGQVSLAYRSLEQLDDLLRRLSGD